jgi:hypothetical protein
LNAPQLITTRLGWLEKNLGYSIRSRVSAATLRSAVSGPFRGQVAGLRLDAPTVSVLHFREKVVRVGEAKRALLELREADLSEPAIAFCWDLTEEARLALTEKNVLIARTSFGWTEQSYDDIRVYIGSRVKRPQM